MEVSAYPDFVQALAALPKPCAFLDLEAFDANIDTVARRLGSNKMLRVATKSVRCVAALRRIEEQFPKGRVVGWMTYDAREVAFLADQGFDHFLMGYPVVSTVHAQTLCRVAAQGKEVIAMVDRLEHLTVLETAAAQAGVTLPVCLDLDMSSDFGVVYFGVKRSSIRTAAAAAALAEQVLRHPHLRLVALMGYEAQIAGLGDRVPGRTIMNAVIRWLKQRSVSEITLRRAEAVRAVERTLGYRLDYVNGGGTGSLETTNREDVVTEVTVGSGFFQSHLFDHYSNFTHRPAAGYALEVSRKPESGIVTCSGGGYVASGAPGWEKVPQVWLPRGLRLLPNEAAGEVQTPIQLPKGFNLSVGDTVLMRHAKAGELCERFQELHVVRQGALVDTYPTYRGQGQCFM
jgi:D-serine deaminase-like pyridoxal phosphate-dependent protein